MADHIRNCVICGQAYKYCMSCPEQYNTRETWRNIFCSENCRDIYQTYNSLKAGEIDMSAARQKMKALDMSRWNKVSGFIKEVLSPVVDETAMGRRKANPPDDPGSAADPVSVPDQSDASAASNEPAPQTPIPQAPPPQASSPQTPPPERRASRRTRRTTDMNERGTYEDDFRPVR
ncbi:MAG: hypothetical protein IJ058_15260 [Lachnospiraceae bacterium]|nr:hypothetical protein [Lachnospiraceae bacterium]MBQ8948139.1 hypothetical protein [Lachnospiraceae bacterium]